MCGFDVIESEFNQDVLTRYEHSISDDSAYTVHGGGYARRGRGRNGVACADGVDLAVEFHVSVICV